MADENFNEFFLTLPEDPEEAFVVFQKQKFEDLEAAWRDNVEGWHPERTYVNAVLAFDEVYSLGALSELGEPPYNDADFSNYFKKLRYQIDKVALKFELERARRLNQDRGRLVKLDESSRSAIRQLINSLRERLDTLDLTEEKRRELVAKLNAFASQVEQNLSRTEAFNSFVVELGRTVGTATAEFQPFTDTINRVLDYLDKGKDWLDSLPPWSERKKFSGPQKQLKGPEFDSNEDDIPF